MFIVREESPQDVESIYTLNALSFGQEDEARLVNELRVRDELVLSLVGQLESQLIAHLAFSVVFIKSDTANHRVVGLAPMSVMPAHQREGFGAKLIAHGLSHLKELGFTAVVVLGCPEYYLRFGFVPANRYGICCSYDCPEDAFMVKELRPGGLEGMQGKADFCSAFEVLQLSK